MSKTKLIMHEGSVTSSGGGAFKRQVTENTYVLVGSLCLCVASLAISGCSKNKSSKISISAADSVMSNLRAVRRGLPGEIETLDPYLANDNFSLPVVRDIYEGLTTEDIYGNPVPGVAESWEIDPSASRYTFKIRRDARWSNGEPIKASEFVSGMRHAVDPHVGSGSAALLSVIKGANSILSGQSSPETLSVEAPDETTVVIRLEHPAPYFLQILSEPIAAPLHITQNSPAGSFVKGTEAIVNGPYMVSARVMGSYIDLEKNRQYWNSQKVAISRIRYSTQESETTELNQFLAGEIDLTSTIPSSDLSRLSKDHPDEIQSAPFLGTAYLALNTTEQPLNAGNEIRQALSLTVDREEIADHVIVGVTPAYNFVADGVTGYKAQTYEWQRWTQEKRLSLARALYAKAGFSKARPLQLRVYFNSSNTIQRTMIAISEKWKETLGVQIEMKSTEFRIFLDEKKDRTRWDVIRLGWFADYNDPYSFLQIFTSDGKQNDSGYSHESYDALLRFAEMQPNSEKRIALFEEAEARLLADYPVIPVYFYRQRRLVNAKLRGASITPLNHTRSQFLYWDNQPLH